MELVVGEEADKSETSLGGVASTADKVDRLTTLEMLDVLLASSDAFKAK